MSAYKFLNESLLDDVETDEVEDVDIETEDSQKIADIILQEAIDNNYGIPKDDMTVIVAKVKDLR